MKKADSTLAKFIEASSANPDAEIAMEKIRENAVLADDLADQKKDVLKKLVVMQSIVKKAS